MGPSTAIPLHFSLEFLGVAAVGGLFAWAAQSRRGPLAGALGALGAGQMLHVLAVPGRAPSWIVAVASVTAAVLAAGVEDRSLWGAGWLAVAFASLVLAAGSPHATDASAAQLWLHALAAAGFVALAVWTWRRSLGSVRLRLVGAFALVLVVVVTIAGGSVVRVVSSKLESEELDRLGVQAEAQQVALSAALDDLRRRSALVSAAFTRDLATRGSTQDTSRQFRLEVFTDLREAGFVALYDAQRTPAARDGLEDSESAAVGASPVVSGALGGQGAQAFTTVPGALLALAANPVYRAGAPQAPGSVIGAAVLGLRFGPPEMERIAERTGRNAAVVGPDGRVVATDPRMSARALPASATGKLRRGESWSGEVGDGESRLLAVAVPLRLGDGTVPASILRASSDAVLRRTTIDVSRALFGAVLAATLIAILIALWFGSRLARPILALTRTARRVEEGDLEATTDVSSSDEVGVLASAFNGMTTSLRDTIAAEQGTRRRLETIVGGMGEGLVAMDADYNIVSFNPAAEEITGIEAGDAVGRKCYDVYGESTAARDGRPICEYLCPLRHDGGKDGDVSIRSRDGRRLSLAVTCSTLRDADGNVIGGVDLLRDVTAEMQAERMKSTVISRTSHELRTPLTPIKGYAQLMLRKEVPRPQRVQYLTEILESTERLERIASILVDVAAMDAGRLQASVQETDPGALLRQAADRWAERGVEHDIRTAIQKGLPPVGADGALVGRALDELVANAVQFSPASSRIVLGARKAARGVELSVTDRGEGIAADQLEGIFDEFVQAGDDDGPVKGLGVGLSFVRGVVEAHGGTVGVASRPGRGSTFSFVLPAFSRARRGRGRKAS